MTIEEKLNMLFEKYGKVSKALNMLNERLTENEKKVDITDKAMAKTDEWIKTVDAEIKVTQDKLIGIEKVDEKVEDFKVKCVTNGEQLENKI